MPEECDLDVEFFAPPKDLAPCFTTLYRLKVSLPEGETVTDYLQPEWSNLRFFCNRLPLAEVVGGEALTNVRFAATGPSSLPTKFTIGANKIWGIGLLPLGWARLMGTPASHHANSLVDGEKSIHHAHFAPLVDMLCDPACDDDAAQIESVFDFVRKQTSASPEEPRILAVHEAMIDPYLLKVSDFADTVGVSQRTLERICLKHFGFPPRLLLRRQRMMRTLAAFMLQEGGSWTNVIDRHYHDQAHFVREFHTFMTMSPTEYASLPHPILEAFMTERQRIWGSPAQTLDKPR